MVRYLQSHHPHEQAAVFLVLYVLLKELPEPLHKHQLHAIAPRHPNHNQTNQNQDQDQSEPEPEPQPVRTRTRTTSLIEVACLYSSLLEVTSLTLGSLLT